MAILYRLFGGFDRLIDPLSPPPEADLPPQRARLLLAVLLLTPRKRWQRAALARVLFPGKEESQQLARLSDHLYLLRHSCPELEILTERDNVTWSGKGAVTDHSVFLQATERLDKKSASEGIDELVSALELYHGDLLPEVDLELVNEAREHARVRFLSVLLAIASRWEQEGRLTEAQKWYERHLSIHPGDEEVLLKYLRNCRELGYRSRGLEAYRVAVRYLESLSLSPGKEVRSLALELQSPLVRSRPVETRATEDGASGLERAWWLLSETRALRCLEHLGPEEQADPRWQLRRLMLHEIRGQWSELGEQVRRFLSEQVQSARTLDPPLQALALVLLSRAQAEVDSVADAMRSLDKAQLLLRQALVSTPSPASFFSDFAPVEAHLAWVELLQANLHMRSGTSGRAIEASRRLLGRLEDFGEEVPPWVSVLKLRVTAALGSILLQVGKSSEAMGELDRADRLCEELKASEFQQTLSITRASALDNLGRWDLSGPILEEAAERLAKTTNRFEEGKVLYNWAAHLGNRPGADWDKACLIANRAIEAFRAVSAEGWEASTNTTLGFLLWQAGNPRQALQAYTQAQGLHTKLEEDFYLTEIHSYQALCHRDLGEIDLCLAKSQQGVEASLSGSDTAVSADLWLIRAECLLAAGLTSQVLGPLTKAADLLFAEAVGLPDAEACVALLQRDPMVRLLIARLKEHGLLAAYLERLPPSAFVRPYAQTGLTSVALRRHRIAEAQERLTRKGEIASAARLARLVGAGVRTVERDLAALKKSRFGGDFRD